MQWSEAMLSRSLLCLTLATTLAGCASNLPDAPPQVATAGEFSQEVVPPPEGVADDTPMPFRLAPGDSLRLTAVGAEPWRVEAVVVDAAGEVHLPLVGEVKVSGLSLAAAEDRVTQAYRRYDRYALLTVTLEEAGGHRATVVGPLARPGSYTLAPGTRLSELVARAGGPQLNVLENGETLETADLAGAKLVRGGKALPISLPRALEGHPSHDVRLHPGDILWVPSAHAQRISVLGEVGRPRTVPFQRGMRLTEALALAQGPTQSADLGDVRIIRGPQSAPSVYRARVSALVDGQAPDVELAPGDVVFVTTHWSVPVTRVLTQISVALSGAAVGASLAQ